MSGIMLSVLGSTFGGGGSVIFDHQYSYSFNGSQSSATSLGTIGGGLISDFDLEFEVNPVVTNSNPWVLSNGGYQETNGFLFGIYNPGVAVAGANIGAYGYYGNSALTANTWQSIKIEVRFSGSTNASRTITSYINNTNNGSDNGYSETAINWNNMYIGMGKPLNSNSWQQPYDGQIRNIKLTSFD